MSDTDVSQSPPGEESKPAIYNPINIAAGPPDESGGLAASEETPLLPEQHDIETGDGEHEGVEAREILPSPGTVRAAWPFVKEAVLDIWTLGKNSVYMQVASGILLVFLLSTIYILIYETEKVIELVTDIAVTEIEILKITDSGITAYATAALSWDYSKVNWWYSLLFRTAFTIVGVASIRPYEPFDVFVNFPQSVDEHFYSPVRVNFNDIEVDFSPHQTNEGLTMVMDVEVHPGDATKVYNELLVVKNLLKKPVIQLSVVLVTNFQLVKNERSWGSYAATVRKEVLLNSTSTSMPTFAIDDYDVYPHESSINTELQVTIEELPFPVMASVTEIEWDLYIAGCETNLLYVGSMVSGEFETAGSSPFTVKVNAIIPELSKKLQAFCPDGLSPINKFAKKTLDEEATVFVKASLISDANQKLPKWLFVFLSNNFQPVAINFKEQFGELPSQGFEYELANANILIMNDPEKLPKFYTDTAITFDLPVSNSNDALFNLSKVFGDLCFVYENEIFLKVYLNSWQDITTIDSYFGVHLRNTRLDIIDEEIVTELMLRFLSGEEFKVYGKALLDMDIKTPVCDTIFQRMEHELEFAVQGETGVIEDLNFTISGLDYMTTSTESQLRFFVDMSVMNPLKVGGGVQFMNFLMDYNGTTVGNIEITDTIIESLHPANVTPIVRFKAEDDSSRSAINSVLSDYISGKQPQLTIRGHEKSCNVPKLAKILSSLAVPLQAPGFGQGHGFVISSTFHLLSSQVEVTVYNPIKNQDALLNIHEASVLYEDIEVAYIEKAPILRIPPGISTTQKIPVRIATGTAGDILKKALNSNLTLHTIANFDVVIGQYMLNLNYEGEGVDAVIKL